VEYPKIRGWLRPGAALVLALGLLTATGTQALAGPVMTCDHASWDCAPKKARKGSAAKALSLQHASWDSLLTTPTTGP
jgi:hypothetical protein